MRLRVVDLGLDPDAPPRPREPRRVLEAALRGRVRWLRRQMDPELFQRALLTPMLLHGAFRFPGLDSAPPGIEGIGAGRGWAARARRFRLPPPHQVCRYQPLVEAVIAQPGGEGLSLWVIPQEGLLKGQVERIDRRIEAMRSVLRPHRVQRVDGLAFRAEGDRALRTLLFGALLAGRLPRLPEAMDPVDLGGLWSLVEAAPDDASAEALMEALGRPLPPPLDVLEGAVRKGAGALRLAVPAEICRTWVGGQVRPRHEDDFEEAHRRGRAAALAAIRGFARTVLRHDDAVRHRIARAFLRAGVPSSWLPELAARIDPRGFEVEAEEGRFRVRDAWGQCIVEAASESTARVRALHFLKEAFGRPLRPWKPWARVADFLAAEGPGALMLVDEAL
ncbi:MAG: hypothetical protein D6729_18160, partial [Deltaproteobacteria bacterium]